MESTSTDWRWGALWGVWVGYFAVAEYAALKSTNPKAPLSFFLRHTLGVPHSKAHRRIGQVAFGSGVVWLVSHIYENAKEDS